MSSRSRASRGGAARCACACGCGSRISASWRGCWGGWTDCRVSSRPVARRGDAHLPAARRAYPRRMTSLRAWWRASRLAPPIEWPRWLAPTVLAVLLLATLLLAYRQPLADRLWPDTRAQALLAQASQALSQGHLSAPDGRGARELYQAALAIDPDRSDARVGLARVGQVALVLTDTATT